LSPSVVWSFPLGLGRERGRGRDERGDPVEKGGKGGRRLVSLYRTTQTFRTKLANSNPEKIRAIASIKTAGGGLSERVLQRSLKKGRKGGKSGKTFARHKEGLKVLTETLDKGREKGASAAEGERFYQVRNRKSDRMPSRCPRRPRRRSIRKSQTKRTQRKSNHS